MNKKEILKLASDELRINVQELLGKDMAWITSWDDKSSGLDEESVPDYPNDICAAMTDLFESVYGRGGKIKDGAWVLGTVENGRDCAHACLMWKSKSFTKFRPLQVSVTCPRGEMARAITLCFVCAMLGVSDE